VFEVVTNGWLQEDSRCFSCRVTYRQYVKWRHDDGEGIIFIPTIP